MTFSTDIQRAGDIDWRNHEKLGFTRLTHGVYGRQHNLANLDTWGTERLEFLAHTKAVMSIFAGRNIALFGPTALQVLKVALPTSMQDWATCHVLVPSGTNRPTRRRVTAHHTKSTFQIWRTLDGLPLLHPVDHWLQLDGTDDDIITVADGLMRRQHPLLTTDEFRHRLDELAGTRGVKRARRLMHLVMPGTDSPYETKTRLVLVRAGLPTPAVNFAVVCRTGQTYYLDMAYVAEKVAVEYDGAGHVGNREQMHNDATRRRDLQDEGWLIITATAPDIANTTPLVRSVEEALLLRRGTTAGLGRQPDRTSGR